MAEEPVTPLVGKMNPAIKKLWVAALRSGTYLQGRNFLRRDYGGNSYYCCLGVLCEVLSVKSIAMGGDIDREQKFAYGDEETKYYLPKTMVERAGLLTSKGNIVTIDSVVLDLASHNDEGKTFTQIADAIEEQL